METRRGGWWEDRGRVRSSGCPWPAAVRRTWTSPPCGEKKDKAAFPAAAPQDGRDRTREGQ